MDKPNGYSSPSGTQLAGNPPTQGLTVAAGFCVAGARILEAPTTCEATATLGGDLGCGGSELPDRNVVEDMDFDNVSISSTISTLRASMESVLLRDTERTGNDSTVNPVTLCSDPVGEPGNLSKSQRKRRRRRARNRASALEAGKPAEGGGSGTGSTPSFDVKRTRSVEESSNTDGSPCMEASPSTSQRGKKRKVAQTTSSTAPSKKTGSSGANISRAAAGPSNQSGGSRNAGMVSDIGTPTAKRKPSGVGGATTARRREGHTAQQAGPSTVPAAVASGKSFAEAAAAAMAVFITADKQEGGLTSSQADFLEDRIWGLLGKCREPVRFDGISHQGDSLIVRCLDEKSAEWLIQVIGQTPAMGGVKFVATKSKPPKLTRASCFIPGKKRSVSEMLNRFHIQNPGVDTALWRVLAHTPKGGTKGNPDGFTLVVGLDPSSVSVLKERYGMRLCLGGWRVKFNLQK